MSNYDSDFFATFIESSETSARLLLPELIRTTGASSVLDVGCGLGIWLDVAKQLGVERVHGLDGGDVDITERRLAAAEFDRCDLSRIGLDTPPTEDLFDLAMCLEVAEHLPPQTAPRLVQYLCDRAPVVLFGAAIPFQGGTGHVNEQWPDFWAALFRRHGYQHVDQIRGRWWSDDRVSWWYRQNLILFMSPETARQHDVALATGDPASLVHPELFARHADPGRYPVKAAGSLLIRSIRSAIDRRLTRSRR